MNHAQEEGPYPFPEAARTDACRVFGGDSNSSDATWGRRVIERTYWLAKISANARHVEFFAIPIETFDLGPQGRSSAEERQQGGTPPQASAG